MGGAVQLPPVTPELFATDTLRERESHGLQSCCPLVASPVDGSNLVLMQMSLGKLSESQSKGKSHESGESMW